MLAVVGSFASGPLLDGHVCRVVKRGMNGGARSRPRRRPHHDVGAQCCRSHPSGHGGREPRQPASQYIVFPPCCRGGRGARQWLARTHRRPLRHPATSPPAWLPGRRHSSRFMQHAPSADGDLVLAPEWTSARGKGRGRVARGGVMQRRRAPMHRPWGIMARRRHEEAGRGRRPGPKGSTIPTLPGPRACHGRADKGPWTAHDGCV